jgi:glycosyltransferase involved in cell wall biosynthesis
VSVIMIFLDGEQYLSEAIESVLAQTFLDWELLLVDDGSSDRSADIARGFVRCHTKIRYFAHPDQENRGMSASRNLGLRHARGDYVALLDSDDVFLPEKLHSQVAILDAHPEVAMVYGPTLRWYGWKGGDATRRDSFSRIGVDPDRVYPPPLLPVRYLRQEASPPATCSVLFRRSHALSVGGFVTDFNGMFEDQVFFFKMGLNFRIFVSGQCLDKYRQHAESWTRQSHRRLEYHPTSRLNPARRAFVSWLYEYLRKTSIEDAELSRLVSRELRAFEHPVGIVLYHLLRLKRWLFKAFRIR